MKAQSADKHGKNKEKNDNLIMPYTLIYELLFTHQTRARLFFFQQEKGNAIAAYGYECAM